jgi:DNA-binding XRE family transcriptional regulator
MIRHHAMTAVAEGGQIAELLIAEILVGTVVNLKRTIGAVVIAKTAAKARGLQFRQARRILAPVATRDVFVVVHDLPSISLEICLRKGWKSTYRWNFSSNVGRMVNSSLETPKIWPSPRLIRAGRVLAGADQATLAEKAGVTRQAVSVVETDDSEKMDPRRRKVLEAMQRVLEDEYGIEFFAASENSGEGVRFRKG